MPILEKIIRFGAIAIAVLFIGLSLFGIFGAWFVDRKATDVALKGFGLIETGVQVVDAGVGRVNDLVATSRMEVRQASETITAVGAQPQANRPVLNALNERLETSLAPRIEQMQKGLAPVREALKNVADAVSLLSSLPMMADRAPRLAALDDAFNRLEELSADGKQLRGTLRELVAGQNSDVTAETLASLNALTQRIDTRLAKVQTNIQGVRDDIAALQVRLDTRKSRLLFVFNLLALLSTLMLTWIVYTQSRCHPAPLDPRTAARDIRHQQQQGLLHRHASDVSDHVALSVGVQSGWHVQGSPLPSQGRGEGEGFSQRECAAWRDRTPHLNPLPLAKGRGETNGMELTTGEHYLAAGVILLCHCPVEIKTGTIGRS